MATPKLKIFPRPWFGPRKVLNLQRKEIHGHKVTLQERAMGSLLKVERDLRKQKVALIVVSSFRSHAEQRRIYDSGVRPAAKPGYSFHEQGVAVDLYVRPKDSSKTRKAMTAAGWYNFDPVNDSGHWSKKPAKG